MRKEAYLSIAHTGGGTMVMAYRVAIWMLLVACLLFALPVAAQHVPGLLPERKDRIVLQWEGDKTADIDVLAMFADGTTPVELPAHASMKRPRMTPALAPDGRSLALAAMSGDRMKIFVWTLTSQNAPVGAPRKLSAEAKVTEKFPAWSPNSQRIAYLASDGKAIALRVINRDGTGLQKLATVQRFGPVAWAPNGQSVLFLDTVKGKTLLKQVPIVGGASVILRQDLLITAATFSPDGGKIAAIVTAGSHKGNSALWVLPAFGKGGSVIVKNIVGARSIVWHTPNSITFNADQVGSVKDADIWMTDPAGKRLRGIPGYTGKKRVTALTVQNGDLSASGLPGFDPNAPLGPDARSSAPEQRLPNGPVMISRPTSGEVVRGKVTLKVVAQKGVATVNVRVGNQFTLATLVQKHVDKAPDVAITWDTQELMTPDPTIGVPDSYKGMLVYPDGEYTILVQGLDRDNMVIGTDTIKVRIQNTLAESKDLKPQVLRYAYNAKKQRTVEYAINGRGLLYGPHIYVVKELDAELTAKFRRQIIEERPDGTADVRTEVLAKSLPLRYGDTMSSIPETSASGRYLIGTDGEFSVVPQMMRKIYLPLTQLAVPLPSRAVTVNSSWQGKMWVVPELLERRGMAVYATHSIEGIEMLGDRKTLRIRSTFKLKNSERDFALPLSPSRRAPGLNAGIPTEPNKAIPVQQATGVRFSWFDYSSKKMLRVEDLYLYTFALSSVPTTTSEQPTSAPVQQGMPGMPPPGFQPNSPSAGGFPPGAMGGGMPANPNPRQDTVPQPQRMTNLSGTATYAVRFTYMLDGFQM